MKILLAILRRPYLTLLWTATILVLTLTPSADMPETPTWELLSFDTAAHGGVFALLAALAWPWVRTWSRRPGLVVLISCVSLGALIEGLQYAMHQGRQAEWTDLLGDSIGIVLVLALIELGRRRLAATATLLLVCLAAAHAQPTPPADGPDLARARRTIAALAAPAMHGRGYVQGGEHLAAAYLRGRLRQLGLQPLAPDYTQPFTLDVNTFPGKAELEVSFFPSAPVTRLVAGADFIASPAAGPAHLHQAAVEPLDTLIFQDSTAARRYLLPLPGPRLKSCTTCQLLLRARDQARLPLLPAATQARIAQRGQLVLVPKLTASLAGQQAPAPQLEILASKWPAAPGPQFVTLALDAQLLHDYQTQNLAAVVRGSAQPDSFLVITAHYDHLGMMGKQVYFPGANDNASGVALLLELAAHYARPENQPAYSVAFLLFGAEEAGLVGSAYFVAHPLLPLARIKFLVNLDLLGTGEEGATIVNGRVYGAAYQRLLALNEAHHYLPKLTARGRAANSDHYPFSEAGVPAFFMYTRGGSQAYHDVRDQPTALSLVGFGGAYGLVRDFLATEGAAPTKSPGR